MYFHEDSAAIINRAIAKTGQSVTLRLNEGSDLTGTMTKVESRIFTVTATGPVVWTVPLSSVLAIGSATA